MLRVLVPISILLLALLAIGCGGKDDGGFFSGANPDTSSKQGSDDAPGPSGGSAPGSRQPDQAGGGAPVRESSGGGAAATPARGGGNTPAPSTNAAAGSEAVKIASDGVELQGTLKTAAGAKRRVTVLYVSEPEAWDAVLTIGLNAAGSSVLLVKMPKYKDHLNGFGDRDLALVEKDVEAAVKSAQSKGFQQVSLLTEYYGAVGAARVAGKQNLVSLIIVSPRVPVSADLSGLKTSKARKIYTGADEGGVTSTSVGLLASASSGTQYQLKNLPVPGFAGLAKSQEALELVINTLAK